MCRSQAYRGFESLPLYKAFQRELRGFFIGENDGILIPKVFENKKGTQFAKRMVLGFVQDALRADSETEWKLSLPIFVFHAIGVRLCASCPAG